MKRSSESLEVRSDSSPDEAIPCDLVFPDWSGMKHFPRRLTLEEGFRMSEEYMTSGLVSEETKGRRHRDRFLEEFVL